MRIALLSTQDIDRQPGQLPAAFRQFGGTRLIERQLDIALDAGCTLVACLTDTIGKEVIELQHRAEQAGARFLVLREARKLIGIGTTADEVLVLAPGLLPDETLLGEELRRPVIFTLPAETAVPLGYERIDAGEAWAGVLLTRAALVEQFAMLPEDSDPMSALLRLSLQSGVPRRSVPQSAFDEGEWQLSPTQEVLDERAGRWVEKRAALAPFSAPGRAVADRMGARLARDLIGKGGAHLPNAAGMAAGILSLAACYFELPVVALSLMLAMCVFVAMGEVIDRVLEARPGEGSASWFAGLVRGLVDPLLLVSLAVAAPEADGWLRLYVPLVMLAVLRLGGNFGEARWQPTFSDRILLAALFVPAALFGLTQPLAAAITLGALIMLYRLIVRD